jgi:hypothetical protein
MNPLLARQLTRLYPRAWRERYGPEFAALLADEPGDFRTFANVLWAALCEHLYPTQGGNMNQLSFSFGAIIKQPSAFVPLTMSILALTLVISSISLAPSGPARETDEGAVAHLWQILMAGQLPIVAFFAVRWLPRAPKQSLYVLALQTGAVLASMAPVFYFNL